jgi:hypothetical protein
MTRRATNYIGIGILLANLMVLGHVVKIYTEVLKMRALTKGDRWDGKDR